jgi:uncharacterized membrane protein YkoI
MKRLLFLLLVVGVAGSVVAEAATVISKQAAEQHALAAAGGGTVVQAVLETNLGKKTWSIDIVGATHEYEVWVDAYTGAVLRTIVQPLGAASATLIPKSQAEHDALNAVGGGSVVYTTLETENGRKIYSVDITGSSAEYEVLVDAHSGAILKIITQPLTALSCKFVSEAVAQKDALAAVGGGSLIQATLEKNDSPAVWSLDVLASNGNEYEVKVNACTGRIVTIIGG